MEYSDTAAEGHSCTVPLGPVWEHFDTVGEEHCCTVVLGLGYIAALEHFDTPVVAQYYILDETLLLVHSHTVDGEHLYTLV